MSPGQLNRTIEEENLHLLIIDDEEPLLLTLEKVFEESYIVRTAESAEEALEILQSGYRPAVIMTDQSMSGMTGVEFLEKSQKYCPDAVKIILTAHSEPDEIIAALNQGKAFMYLTKPINNIEITQAVRIAFDKYNSHERNEAIINELTDINRTFKKSLNENETDLNQVVLLINSLIKKFEKGYLTSHTNSVVAIAKKMSEKLKLTPRQRSNIIIASLLHNYPFTEMNDEMQLLDPTSKVDKSKLDNYFSIFDMACHKLSNVAVLKKHAKLLMHLWEHYDGSGKPKGLKGKDIAVEAQIIAISVIYHNYVYRLSIDDYKLFKKSGEFTQMPQDTIKQHDSAINFLSRHKEWFYPSIVDTFIEIADSGQLSVFQPVKQPLSLHCEKTGLSYEKTDTGSGFSIPEREISVDRLKMGMILADNVMTKKGIVIASRDSKIDQNILRQIDQLAKNNLLRSNTIAIIDTSLSQN